MKVKFAGKWYDIVSALQCAALCLIMLSLSGCCTQRRATVTATTTTKDSTNVNVRVETVVEYHTDTVFVNVPAQNAERTTQDSISHLENDYATSDARINPDGSLFHNLNTKAQQLPVEVQIPTITRDSIRIEYRETEVETEVPVEVEKKLTWWQATCIKFFPWALGLIAGGIGFYFRKPLFALIRRVLLKF